MKHLKIHDLIKQSDFLRKIIHSFLGKGTHIIFTLTFSLICTRLYGVGVFGEYTYYYTIISLAMLAATAGMNNGFIYTIPKYSFRYLSFGLLVNFLFSILLIAFLFFFSSNEDFVVMLPMIWLLSMEQLFLGVYQGTGDIKGFYRIFGFWSMVIRLVFVIGFYYLFGNSILYIIIGVYISLIISNTIYLLHFKKSIKEVRFDSFFLKYSFPLMLTSIMAAIINKIDIIMLGGMTSHQEVGIYQITFQIANTMSIILLIFNTAFSPTVSKLYHEGNINKLRSIYIKSTRFLGAFSLIYIVIIIIFGEFILQFFGEEVLSGYLSLIFRSIGQFVNVAVGSVWFMISMTGNPKPQMFTNILALFLNVILNYILIPIYAINGAAFASMISLIFLNIVGYKLVTKKFKLKAYKHF